MNIISADYIYTPSGYVTKQAIAFDETIKAIDTPEKLMRLYPDASLHTTKPNSVIYPGFINTHVHLEFSDNQTSFAFGSFVPWLASVISNTDKTASCDDTKMQQACEEMLKSGITSFGAISSHARDIEVCAKTPQRVVYFNEIVGSNANNVNMIYEAFMDRVKLSQQYASNNFMPAIAVHSAYSTHPDLVRKAVSFAKENNYLLSAHLLESPSEREWLTNGSGEFYEFYKNFLGTDKPVNTLNSFLEAFNGMPTHFVHAVQATQEELDALANSGHSIAHCPRSNRMLGCGRLAIEDIKAPLSIATDGLSSNWSLNIFDELKAALMIHHKGDLTKLSLRLIRAVTQDAATILGLECGMITPNKKADFCVVTLPDTPTSLEEIALWTILHTREATEVYIGGKQYVSKDQ